MTNFVKKMNITDKAFKYFTSRLQTLSETKQNKGCYQPKYSVSFKSVIEIDFALHSKEKAEWKTFKVVANRFFVIKGTENRKELKANFMKTFKYIGCNVTKDPFFWIHLRIFFPKSVGQ